MIRNNSKAAPTSEESSQDSARLWELQAEICQLMANPKRLQILNLLKWGELSVGAMVQSLGIPKANLSQHLALMRQKGILATRRQGTTIFYRLATPDITTACEIMREVLLDTLSTRGRLSRNLQALEDEAPEE
ncbi:MAG: metalloregulator ArsR/SmtB family transcription factor [Deltaproteobacteria bacterium]|nr:metalloregulator ArsR/SmtB family transcription factor [Deltaproteobacteria bacterium]